MLNTKPLQVVALAVVSTAGTYYGLHTLETRSRVQGVVPLSRNKVERSQAETSRLPAFVDVESSRAVPIAPSSPYLAAGEEGITFVRDQQAVTDRAEAQPLAGSGRPALSPLSRAEGWVSGSQATFQVEHIAASRKRVHSEPITSVSDTETSIRPLMLKEGTELRLQLAQEVSSKTSFPGDPVAFTVADEVSVDNVVVVRAGTHATGEITMAKRSGALGRGGELSIRVDHLNVGGRQIPLRGSKGADGRNQTGKTVALTVAFGGVGLLKHGKNVSFPEGTPLTAYVAESVNLLPAS